MDFELSEELKMVQGLARDFVEEQLKPLEREVLGRAADLSDARAWLPQEKEAALVKMVRDMGLWGIGVPEELGGAGLSALAVCLVEEELARTIVPFHFGDVTPILFDCNQAQREKFLLPALNYEKRPYLALVEPESGADTSQLTTTAQEEDGGYILSGKKLSLSRPSADYFAIIFASTGKGITCFIVEKDTPGFSVTGGAEKSGWQATVREGMTLVFDNCRVPAENILGEEGGAFRLGGKYMAQRRIVRGARCIGAARRLLEEATAYAQSTETFGKTIDKRANVRTALAEIAMHIHAARLMVYEAACKADSGKTVKNESAMVKLYTTHMLNAAADSVAHIYNGPPYIAGMPMERFCRRALETIAAEFTLKHQRSIIAKEILNS